MGVVTTILRDFFLMFIFEWALLKSVIKKVKKCLAKRESLTKKLHHLDQKWPCEPQNLDQEIKKLVVENRKNQLDH